MNFFKATCVFLLTFLVIDGLWINLFAINLYNRDVGALMAESPRVGPAILFYIGYAAAAVHLVVRPSQEIKTTVINGAVLGAVAYGTFAVSNYALLESWTAALLTVDIIFGTVVTAVCCLVASRFSGYGKPNS